MLSSCPRPWRAQVACGSRAGVPIERRTSYTAYGCLLRCFLARGNGSGQNISPGRSNGNVEGYELTILGVTDLFLGLGKL